MGRWHSRDFRDLLKEVFVDVQYVSSIMKKNCTLLHGEDLPIVVYSLGICICHVHLALEKVHSCVNYVINKGFFSVRQFLSIHLHFKIN